VSLFRRSRRDPESLADLFIRAAGSEQLNDLPLSLGDARRNFGERLLHGRDGNNAVLDCLLTVGSNRPGLPLNHAEM
jgi:hypothetical protein